MAIHATNKNTGDPLQAQEWNNLATDVNILNAGVSTEVDPLDADKTIVKIGKVLVGELTAKGNKGTNVNISGNNNINIEPRPAAGTGEGKNTPGLADRKGGNIALKPGDDIEFWAHKRGTSKNDEVSVKIMTEVPKASDPTKTDEVAAKLQLNTADIVLTSKDKQEESDEMNIIVNQDTNTRGYLKVRAQAIDLRSESHGGIALQPKGYDGDVTPHMNKIKFEHGGGDGLEFGTFNTEKSSLYTDEYRFKKDGKILLSTRTKQLSDKYDNNDETTHWKYPKQNDDFYDIIYEAGYYNYDPTNIADTSITWEDLIRLVAYQKSLGKGPFRGLELNITEENDLSNEHNPYIRINDGTNINVGEITASDIVRWGDSVSIIIEGLSSVPTIKIFKDQASEQTLTTTLVNGIASATFVVPDTTTSVTSIPISITYN